MLTRARLERTFWSEAGSSGSRLVDHALLALSLAYEAGVRLRNRAYDRGVARATRVPCPTICVGNLTVGGSGKTPLVAHLAEGLSRMGRAVAILSRGYGRSGSGVALVAGEDPSRFGDEPVMLAARLPTCSVIVGADRVAAARFAVAHGATTLILDDGFQHRRLARDLDIVVVDGGRGLGNGYLLPRGPLREPPSALGRAGLVLVKRGARSEPWGELIVRGIGDLAEGVPVRCFGLEPGSLRDATGRPEPLASLRGQRVVTVAGVGNPDSFVVTVRALGADVVEALAFPDHHRYRPSDLRQIAERARAQGAERVVTTAKDMVKLAGVALDPAVVALDVGVSVEGGLDLVTWVAAALE